MVSIQHPQAEYFFDRDVACLRDFFRRRFDFESDSFPAFSEVNRVDAVDAEVSASGITRQMEKDLLQELGVEDESDEDDDSEEEEDEDEDVVQEVDEECDNEGRSTFVYMSNCP